MEEIQQSKLIFYLPIMAGYAGACMISYFLFNKLGMLTKNDSEIKPEKPYLELVLALIAIVGVLVVGRVYTAGYLIPSKYNPIAWTINNFIIYSPIFILLIIRKQPTTTIWISTKKWYLKLTIGAIATIIALSVFLGLRLEWYRWTTIIMKSFSLDGLSYFAAIFFEGIAVAFLFVRLKWVSSLKVALVIPALLFALAHLPGMLNSGDPWWHMVLMSGVTGIITVFVLYVCNRTKDIIWIGIVHYFLDAAINAY